jgi:hypothetical protein
MSVMAVLEPPSPFDRLRVRVIAGASFNNLILSLSKDEVVVAGR